MSAVLPTTLQEAIVYFSDVDVATEFVRDVRWPHGVECPTCGCKQVSYLKTRRVWKCKNEHPKRQFTAKVGTIFEDSPLGLDKWIPAVWLVTNCKNGISSYELAKGLSVTQKSAWFMLHRARLAMKAETFEKLSGEVETDEAYIGGNVRNMHKKSKRRIKANNDGNRGKTVVLGLLQRDGEARAMVAPTRKAKHLHAHLRDNVEPGTMLYTDNYYQMLDKEFLHQFVDHVGTYVQGRVHTNGMENFWSLLKHTIGGTYVSVDPVHLCRYVDEQCFRYNKRRLTDAERFVIVISQVIGRRLTYAEVTGKIETPQIQA